MAATLGHIEIELLGRYQDGEPILLGTVQLPVEVQHGPGRIGRVVVDPAKVRATLAAAVAEASTVAESEPWPPPHRPDPVAFTS